MINLENQKTIEKMFILLFALKFVLVENLGSSVTSFGLTSGILTVSLSNDGSRVLAGCANFYLYYYQRVAPGVYVQAQNIYEVSPILSCSLADNGVVMYLARGNSLKGYNHDGSLYQMVTSDSFASNYIRTLHFNPGAGIAFIGGVSGTVHIYLTSLTPMPNISDSGEQVVDIDSSLTGSVLAVGCVDQKVRIYDGVPPTAYTLRETLTISQSFTKSKISKDGGYLFIGTGDTVQIYEDQSGFVPIFEFQTGVTSVQFMAISSDAKSIVVAESSSNNVYVYDFDQVAVSVAHSETVIMSAFVVSMAMSFTTNNLLIATSDNQMKLYDAITTIHNTPLDNLYVPPSPPPSPPNPPAPTNQIADNCKIRKGQHCEVYCPEECNSCSESGKCKQCAEYHVKNEEGQCVVENIFLKILIITNSVFSQIRVRKVRFFFFVIENFWLYEYHEQEYPWLCRQVFSTIRLIQSKKDQIIDGDKLMPFIKDNLIPWFPQYGAYAREKFVTLQGNGGFFLDSLAEFLCINVPFTILTFFLLNRLFYCLFSHPFSAYLRTFSFWGFLAQMLLEGNLEYFAFLAANNSKYMFVWSFPQKLHMVTFVVGFYFVFLGAVGSFFLFAYFYKKLAKYFLTNLFRIPGSLMLMTYLYGLRPFIKGALHAYLCPYNEAQLISLALVEIFTCILLVLSQAYYQPFIFKSVYLMEFVFYLSLGNFNILLLWSRYLDDSVMDAYLYTNFIIIILVSLGKVILQLVLCRQLTETNYVELIGPNKMKIVIHQVDRPSEQTAQKQAPQQQKQKPKQQPEPSQSQKNSELLKKLSKKVQRREKIKTQKRTSSMMKANKRK